MVLYELLVFSGRTFTLGELAEKAGHSRQTIARRLEQLHRYNRLGSVKTREKVRERFYQMALSGRPKLDISPVQPPAAPADGMNDDPTICSIRSRVCCKCPRTMRRTPSASPDRAVSSQRWCS